jgi:hypothetical protein
MFGLLKQPAARLLVKQRRRTGNSQANWRVKIQSCAAKSCPPEKTYINDPTAARSATARSAAFDAILATMPLGSAAYEAPVA